MSVMGRHPPRVRRANRKGKVPGFKGRRRVGGSTSPVGEGWPGNKGGAGDEDKEDKITISQRFSGYL